MATEPVTDQTALQGPAAWETEAEREGVHGVGPWRLGLRRLRRNKVALLFGLIFVLLVAACAAAPLWANQVAKTGPNENHLTDTVVIDGKETDVVALNGVPIGPTWQGQFFLGADTNGRDVMVRLLYGGRNSLVIGLTAAFMTTVLSIVLGLLAGFLGGKTDTGIRFLLDVMWSFPVVILGVALGVALALGGLKLGPITISGDSLVISIFVIGLVYIPYMARPVRGQVLSLREKEFIEAGRSIGASSTRILFREILPNLAAPLIVYSTLIIPSNILLEAALSFLGAGVRPPNPSWGTMIDEGVERIATAPHLAIVPGAMLVLTVLALNVFGDGVRDALDPRAKVRIEH